MELVTDANILFAILIKEGKTEELLYKIKAYAPEFLLEEFEKYRKLILEKTERREQDFSKLMAILKTKITLVPNKEIDIFMKEAEKICPDKNDIRYFAVAMVKKCAIWSNDRKMRQQNKIKVYSTQELAQMFS